MISSLAAQSVTRTVLAPFERLKIIMQTQPIMRTLASDRYSSYANSIKRIHNEQGLLSFWRGNITNIYRILPTCAIKFSAFSYFADRFSSRADQSVKNQHHVIFLRFSVF